MLTGSSRLRDEGLSRLRGAAPTRNQRGRRELAACAKEKIMKTARLDPKLTARVVGRRALRYDAAWSERVGASWVRAGSALARFGKRLLVVQDDALWLAWWDDDGALCGQAMPADASGRRLFDDKRAKPDFEAATVLGDSLFVFGSGSLPSRERIAVVSQAGDARILHAASLYARLRSEASFAGRQLNVEGALVEGNRLVLYTRGNAAALATGDGFDASVELDVDDFARYCAAPEHTPAPALFAVTQYRLGQIDGVRLTLTDAALRDGARYDVAAAEASPDAIADGEVRGTSFGILDDDPRYALIVAEDGRLLRDKVEGLVPDSAPDRWLLITDPDDASRPAELLTLQT
jgi:hypothetical protein